MPGSRLTLYTDSYLVRGVVNTGGRRLSDYLNDPRTAHVDVEQATWQDLLSEDSAHIPAALVTIRKDSVQLVIPEDVRDPHAPRVQTYRVAIDLAMPLLAVRGTIHRRPGDPTTLAQLFSPDIRYFTPVTEAWIRYLPNGSFDTLANTVLINTLNLSFWALQSGH